jgi:predicted nucleic acid-binding protein
VIVVDTSVWIDVFAGRRDEPHVVEFLNLVSDDAPLALTDVILTEVLQGLRDDRSVAMVEGRLAPFEVLRLHTLDDYRRAASLYRQARRGGVTVRRTIDCLIASVCVREQCSILHNDRDFDLLAGTTELSVHPMR